jgi:hypothetical protein
VNAHALAPWWELLKDFLIPVAAILVPTLIAICLARTERLAAAAARADDRRLAQEEAIERERREGGLAAIQAMEGLLTAAAEEVKADRAVHTTRSRALISTITLHLAGKHDPVWEWIVQELGVVVQGVNDAPSKRGLPYEFVRIRARHSAFQIELLNWLQGARDDAWFENRTHLPLSQTPLLGDTPDP